MKRSVCTGNGMSAVGLGNFNALLHVFEVGKNDFNGATNSIDGYKYVITQNRFL